jgi:hypothetical protein
MEEYVQEMGYGDCPGSSNKGYYCTTGIPNRFSFKSWW